LGLSLALQELYEFSPNSPQFDWTATVDLERPWAALAKSASGEENNPIPVVLDQNTAAWSLKQGASLGATIQVNIEGKDIFFQTVGLLSNSVLQGKLLIDEANFERLFPKVSGYSFFLIRSDHSPTPETADSVAAILEKGWGDVGLDVTSSVTVLERLLGVQNTYISAFQSLGALGLLLGTFGLVAVQIRSVVERRRELALMQAVGFSNARLAKLLTLETALLLGGGLCIGVLCAAVALVPYVIETGPQLSLFNPLLMLLAVLVAGFLAATLAVRAATRQSVLSGLRAE
jgi:ABC-type antimicrobial peptide transport system permease subunit